MARRAGEGREGVRVFRGYNRSDGTTNERNLVGVRTVDEVLGRPANRPEMLPLEYYTESPTDAGNYAAQDRIYFNDGLIPMARQEYNQLVMDGRTPAEDRDTWVRRRAEDAYSILTGRDRVTNGHVEEHTIYPRKTLDLSGVGEQASVDDIYRAISDQTGIPENTLDDALILMDIDGVETPEDPFDVFRVLRNEGTSGKVGSRLVQFLRDNGYDSVKYAESGTNHYAMLAEEPGENPARMVDVPRSTDGEDRVRRWARTVMEAEVTPDGRPQVPSGWTGC